MRARDVLVIQKKPFFICMLTALAVVILGGLIQARQLQSLQSRNTAITADLVEAHSKLNEVDKSLTRIAVLSQKLDKKHGISPAPVPSSDTDKLHSTPKTLLNRLSVLLIDSRVAAHRLENLAGAMERRERLLSAIPSRVPVNGRISSSFGLRKSPFTKRRIQHKGLDIAAKKGTPVLACADGEVVFSGWSRAYGKALVVAHGYGIVTKYAHNSQLYAQVGEHVSKGQVISRVGSTGRSTGAHLHYEVWVNGKPVNPRRFLVEQESYETLVSHAVTTEESIRPVLSSLANFSFDRGNSLSALNQSEPVDQSMATAAPDGVLEETEAIGGEDEFVAPLSGKKILKDSDLFALVTRAKSSYGRANAAYAETSADTVKSDQAVWSWLVENSHRALLIALVALGGISAIFLRLVRRGVR